MKKEAEVGLGCAIMTVALMVFVFMLVYTIKSAWSLG